MATPVKAIYDHGTLKLLEPLDLADGTEVEVVVMEPNGRSVSPTTDEELAIPPAIKTVLDDPNSTPFEILEAIAALPLEGSHEPFSGRDHDEILYGGKSAS